MARSEISKKDAAQVASLGMFAPRKEQRLFDATTIGDPQAAMEFIPNILKSSTSIPSSPKARHPGAVP